MSCHIDVKCQMSNIIYQMSSVRNVIDVKNDMYDKYQMTNIKSKILGKIGSSYLSRSCEISVDLLRSM